MAQQPNQRRTSTSTQIRNMYSDTSYLNIKFYNTNLSFQFSPLMSTDNMGRANFDTKNAQMTTVNYENAYAIYKVCSDILAGKISETTLVIPCSGDASLTLHHGIGSDGRPESVFTIAKTGISIPFKFKIQEQIVVENGVSQTRIIHSGLGAFAKTVEGYLTGINADRHLDKLTEEYAALQNQQQNGQAPQQGGGYRGPRQGGQPYNNGYKKQYPPRQPQQPYNQQQWQQPNQQNMSNYQLPN